MELFDGCVVLLQDAAKSAMQISVIDRKCVEV